MSSKFFFNLCSGRLVVSLGVRRRYHSYDSVHSSLRGVMQHLGDEKKSRAARKKNDGYKSQTSPSSVTLHVLGCGARGLPKSLYLFTENSRYLFNCGEGVQRLAHEYKLRLSRLDRVFVTTATWEAAGGLPGVALTLQDIGAPQIDVHGPPGLDDLFIATQKFVVLNRMKVETPVCEHGGTFEDASMTVKYVMLKRKRVTKDLNSENGSSKFSIEADDTDYYGHELTGRRHIRDAEMKELLKLSKKEDFYAMCYICRIKPKLGTLDLQKCVNKGIKPGPILGLLKNGEDVTLPDGTIVYANEVRTPDDPGPVFMVIDVPDHDYLDSLLECGSFREHQGEIDTVDRPTVIVHFTPDVVLRSEKYQNFMKSFSSKCSHLIVNDSNSCFGSIAVQRVQHQLNLLDKEIFPLVGLDEYDRSRSNSAENVFYSRTRTFFRLRPGVGLDRSQELDVTDQELKEYIEEPFKNPSFEPTLNEFRNYVSDHKANSPQVEFPKIVFLGTGSCIPNKTRNTSGIMIHFDRDHSMLFDCGEGTFGQMVRFYGANKIDDVLKTLKGIYISHLHADHHIGLINVIQQRKRAMKKLMVDGKNDLYLLAPKQIMPWLFLYHNRFENILSDFTLVPNLNFFKSSEETIPEDLLSYLNLSSVETCHVKHCPNAFGVSVVANGFKITYSGDTMPCANLINIGKNSDILIHEATMEDELKAEAFKKFHTTMDQALSVARQMDAKHTVLTHFSQRYARVPRVSAEAEVDYKTHKVGVAFDNMRVAFRDLAVLPYMYGPLKLLYAEHCEGLEVKAAKRALKRERDESPVRLKMQHGEKMSERSAVED